MRGPIQSGLRGAPSTGLGRVTRGRAATRLVQTLPTSGLRNNFGGWVGFAFTSAGPVTVTALSRWGLAGNTASHAVKLWTNGGSELAAATVDCSPLLADGWVDGPVTPFVLAAGTYRLASAELAAGDEWYDLATYTLAAGMTTVGAIFGVGSYADGASVAGQAFVPVSLQFRP